MESRSKRAEGPHPEAAERTLKGQLILVTGGAVRVGRAICQELARSGAQVAIHCHRSQSAAAELAAELGAGAFALSCDLRDGAATSALFDEAVARSASRRIDGLVNSAALFTRAPFAALTDAEWEEQLAVNLTAPQRCTRLAVARGATGIVNLVDIAAWQPWREFSAYGSAKAGLLQLTRVLARELAPRVRVNAVAPGTVLLPQDDDDDGGAKGEGPSAELRSRLLARIPLGHIGQPLDVARAVRFLLTEPFLTGVCLPVDGGQGLL